MSIQKRTITRRMDSVLNELADEFKALYTKDDFTNILNRLEKEEKEKTSGRLFVLDKLHRMLKNRGINFDETKKDFVYYKDLINQNITESLDDVIESMLYKLYKKFNDFPTPEEYMKRIVDKLCNQSDDWQKDTLRLRILKQFIKYGNYLYDAGFKKSKKQIQEYVTKDKKTTDEYIANNVDDDIFKLLESASAQDRRPDGKFGLLKVADDLATGKFRAEGSTKKNLYLFAMVFNMTYLCGEDCDTTERSTMIDPDSDIVKNLFNDYYSNNFMRFITDAYNNGELEREPSGQGINYKNFAEMIYLYYISKNIDPKEKIKKSNDMITRVKKAPIIKEPQLKQKSDDGETESYMNLFSEEILKLEEKEFEKFICENYNHNINRGNYKIGVLQVETNQQTAFDEYQGIRRKIVELYRNYHLNSENADYYGICDLLVPDDEDNNNLFADICNIHNDIDGEKFEEFKELLRSINSFMSYSYFESISKKNVSRTSMIAAWYHYFNLKKTEKNKDTRLSFQEVFEEFDKGIKYYLEQSNYQPLNGKNIFDVMVVFAAYLYINTIDK